MTIKLQLPKLTHLRPRITVVGVGGAGSNAVNNMITSGLTGVNFVVANTDSQSLANSAAEHGIQLGAALTEGLGAGAKPEVGRAAAEEAMEEIRAQVAGSHMVFVAAGMGGGTGTGAAAVIARIARECGALTVGVVTKPFHFEGTRRMRAAESGIASLKSEVDTLIVIPNQNLFRIANERTTFAEAFILADQVLYSGIACVVDLIVKEGLINLDFADVRTIMSGMGTAMMGTGEAAGDKRAVIAAEEAISNPLLDDISLRGAKGLLLSITGGRDLKLYEVDEAAQRVRQEIDGEANIIVGATFDDTLGDRIRVSIVASGMERLGEMEAAWAVQSNPAPQQPLRIEQSPPSPSELQPPFIEPYPEPYSQQSADYAPVHPEPQAQPPVRPQVHEQAAPPPHNQFQGHAQSSEASVAPASAHDLARALSDALEGHTEEHPTYSGRNLQSQPAFPPEPPATWSSDDGAVFHDAPPQVGSDPLATLGQSHSARGTPAPGFYPQPPMETQHRPGRRLPEVQDFPVVGQREYHAKSAQYAEPADMAPPPRAYIQPLPQDAPAPKRGFFARMFGRKPREPQKQLAATRYPHPAESQLAHREQLANSDRSKPQTAARSHRKNDDEGYEMPTFFGSDRK